MGKKCIPGVFCIENMTLFLLIFILILMFYYFMQLKNATQPQIVVIKESQPTLAISERQDTFNDPYSPPTKNDPLFYTPKITSDIRPVPGVPINIETRGLSTGYQQIGILTPSGGSRGNDSKILPLMGRRLMSGRDKWQYYTIANNGNLNTKLPISVNGKSCTSEYGCDSIYNSDTVYVEGYNETFRATIYDNNLFQYLPF
uniref:Uncharacterized protein n=1 Tax=viral metagenome TaxID=1070528 RepID=A0A6C0H3A2_9ZZZZ